MGADVQDLTARYGAAWAAHDVEAIMALHTDDTVFHLHGVFSVEGGLLARKDTYLDWTAVQRQLDELAVTRS